MKKRFLASLFATTLLLSGCSLFTSKELAKPLPIATDWPGEVMLLQEVKATVGKAPDAQTHLFQALFWKSEDALDLTLLSPLGQKLWTIRFKDGTITETRHVPIPAMFEAQQLLRDIAVVFWPEASLKRQITDGSVKVEGSVRHIAVNGEVLHIETSKDIVAGVPQTAHLHNTTFGYHLTIQSTGL